MATSTVVVIMYLLTDNLLSAILRRRGSVIYEMGADKNTQVQIFSLDKVF